MRPVFRDSERSDVDAAPSNRIHTALNYRSGANVGDEENISS